MNTITKEFTKEQLIERAKYGIERYTKAVAGFPRHMDVAMDLELARIALASLEAVPVPECFKRLLHHAYGMTMGHDWNKGTMAGHHRDKLCRAVEDCRAAMLQSFGNSEQLNSPVLPDGSDDTKRLDWLDAQNKRLNEYYGTSYGWKFDANFQRNAMMLNDSNYPVMTVRQAIDEAMAAAPQQEVK